MHNWSSYPSSNHIIQIHLLLHCKKVGMPRSAFVSWLPIIKSYPGMVVSMLICKRTMLGIVLLMSCWNNDWALYKCSMETNFTFTSTGTRDIAISKTWMLLNSQTTVSVFCDAKLLTQIWPCIFPLIVLTNGGQQFSNNVGKCTILVPCGATCNH